MAALIWLSLRILADGGKNYMDFLGLTGNLSKLLSSYSIADLSIFPSGDRF